MYGNTWLENHNEYYRDHKQIIEEWFAKKQELDNLTHQLDSTIDGIRSELSQQENIEELEKLAKACPSDSIAKFFTFQAIARIQEDNNAN